MSRSARERRYSEQELTDLMDSLPLTLPCLNPYCRSMVGYRSQRGGRQAQFCGPPCRSAYHNERRRLLRALDALTRQPVGSRADKVRRAHLQAKLHWALARYRASEVIPPASS